MKDCKCITCKIILKEQEERINEIMTRANEIEMWVSYLQEHLNAQKGGDTEANTEKHTKELEYKN